MQALLTGEPRLIEAGELTITSERHGAAHLLALSGELDMASTRALDEELHRVEASDADAIVIDLGALDYLDSAGLASIANAHRRSQLKDYELKLMRGRPRVQSAFSVWRLEDRLPFID